MKEIEFKTRKWEGETYTFTFHYPENVKEDRTPYITVETPENCFGYTDTFFYNSEKKSGYYSWRYHPAWITRKIIEVCAAHYDALMDKYYYQSPECCIVERERIKRETGATTTEVSA